MDLEIIVYSFHKLILGDSQLVIVPWQQDRLSEPGEDNVMAMTMAMENHWRWQCWHRLQDLRSSADEPGFKRGFPPHDESHHIPCVIQPFPPHSDARPSTSDGEVRVKRGQNVVNINRDKRFFSSSDY